MPLAPPNLDDRTFDDLVREARLRAARYAGEWTDFNESDPGATIIDLFAWLTELMLFRLNQVPDRSYLKFLRMLNLELRPARPATADVTFTVNEKANPARPQTVQARSRVGGQNDDGELIIFETVEDLELVPLNLVAVQTYDGGLLPY